MDSKRIEALRAYLLVASLAALAINVVTLYAGWMLDVPDSVFCSTAFKLISLAAVGVVMIGVRLRCGVAFRSALGRGAVVETRSRSRMIVVDRRCPGRRLVCLYARLSGCQAVVRA
ncbi:hypothetical protein [Pararobbsia silviterrae]|uniref:Uncharacterized protein n=1 Tax=Pararobbsia silviterrae TaxID=1792498 RepID=A0A494Y6K9_9BURK|nr:hypothetical protein [Pararobbsia silviterrae]RKP55956.1 hypothetical protein D7S86_12260 [Pararobbsia silviterrae]